MIQKWEPDADPHQARRIGKTGEEINELGAVLFRISIQGLHGIDPASGKSNRQRLVEEMADVQAQIDLTCEHLRISQNYNSVFANRVDDKKKQMLEWEAHFK